MIEVIVSLICLTVVNDFAEKPAAVAVNAIGNIAYLVVPGDAEISPLVLLFPEALLAYADTDDTGDVGRFDKNVLTMLVEAFQVNCKAILEELGIYAQACLLGKFRSKCKGCEVSFCLT